MKGILAYLAVVLFTVYWFFMFNDSLPAFMLALEGVYFLPAVLFTVIAKQKISIGLEKLISTAEKNQDVPIRVSIKNKLKFFPVHFRLYFKIENTLTGEKKDFRTKGTVRRNNDKMLTIPISAENCGNMRITLEKVKIYDLLMIMGNIKKIKEYTQVSILPALHLIPVQVTRKTRDFVADADEYSDRESGDDPAEIYQIREYNDNDSIHDIHWKLSAKSDKLLVKERGKALGSSVLIWINTYEKNRKQLHKRKYTVVESSVKNTHNKNIISPDILELAASISLSLFAEECVHTVAWYEPENGRVRKKRVSKEIHIYELLNRLSLIRPCTEEKINVIYKDSFKGENFSTIVEIKIDGEMLVNGEKAEIPMIKRKIVWEQLGITV